MKTRDWVVRVFFGVVIWIGVFFLTNIVISFFNGGKISLINRDYQINALAALAGLPAACAYAGSYPRGMRRPAQHKNASRAYAWFCLRELLPKRRRNILPLFSPALAALCSWGL